MNIPPGLAILEEEDDADYSSSNYGASFTDRAESRFELIEEEKDGNLNSRGNSQSFIDSPHPGQKSKSSSRNKSQPSSSRLSQRENIVDMTVVKAALEQAEYPESDMTENSIWETLGEEYNDNLQVVINGYQDKKMNLEYLLKLAAHDNDQLAPIKKTFWEKFGYSSKKEQELLSLAINEVRECNKNYTDFMSENDKLNTETKQVQDMKLNQFSSNIDMRTTLKALANDVQFGRTNYFQQRTELTQAIELNSFEQDSLVDKLDNFTEHYRKQSELAFECEERWRMYAEELRQGLWKADTECIDAKSRFEITEDNNLEILYEKRLNAHQSEQIEVCLELLSHSIDYFSESEEHTQFNNEFCNALRSMKKAVQDAIQAERDFETQANTDPRDIIPYSRASALIPGTTVPKPNTSPNAKKVQNNIQFASTSSLFAEAIHLSTPLLRRTGKQILSLLEFLLLIYSACPGPVFFGFTIKRPLLCIKHDVIVRASVVSALTFVEQITASQVSTRATRANPGCIVVVCASFTAILSSRSGERDENDQPRLSDTFDDLLPIQIYMEDQDYTPELSVIESKTPDLTGIEMTTFTNPNVSQISQMDQNSQIIENASPYYTAANYYETIVHRVNLALAFWNSVAMVVELITAWVLWNAAEDHEPDVLLLQFLFFKIVQWMWWVYKWWQNVKMKEAAHFITTFPFLSMILLVSISIMIYSDWENSSSDIVLYIQIVFGWDIFLLIINLIVIILVRKEVGKVFASPVLWATHLSLYVRKCLSIFPVSDDMENELAHFEEEEEMLQKQQTVARQRRMSQRKQAEAAKISGN